MIFFKFFFFLTYLLFLAALFLGETCYALVFSRLPQTRWCLSLAYLLTDNVSPSLIKNENVHVCWPSDAIDYMTLCWVLVLDDSVEGDQ